MLIGQQDKFGMVGVTKPGDWMRLQFAKATTEQDLPFGRSANGRKYQHTMFQPKLAQRVGGLSRDCLIKVEAFDGPTNFACGWAYGEFASAHSARTLTLGAAAPRRMVSMNFSSGAGSGAGPP